MLQALPAVAVGRLDLHERFKPAPPIPVLPLLGDDTLCIIAVAISDLLPGFIGFRGRVRVVACPGEGARGLIPIPALFGCYSLPVGGRLLVGLVPLVKGNSGREEKQGDTDDSFPPSEAAERERGILAAFLPGLARGAGVSPPQSGSQLSSVSRGSPQFMQKEAKIWLSEPQAGHFLVFCCPLSARIADPQLAWRKQAATASLRSF